jgi:hypothetical protein
MRFFVCPFGSINIGIPVEAAEALMVYGREAEAAILRDEESSKVFFSLPRFFNIEGGILRHGIILKVPGSISGDSGTGRILLVPVVQQEVDIPGEEIQEMPGIVANILDGMGGVSFITGIRFEESTVTLFINPERLVDLIIRTFGQGRTYT